MRTNAKFKHTNFLKRDRYQAKLNAARACCKKSWLFTFNIYFLLCKEPVLVYLLFKELKP